MAISYISASELIVAEGHPFYADIKNRAAKYIQAQIDVEHSAAGVHDNRETGFHFEEGTYAGTGAGQVINLSNSTLTVQWIEVWYSHAADEPIYSRVFNGAMTEYAWSWIDAGATYNGCFSEDYSAIGSFTVGTNNHTNRNGSTYYYAIFGYDNTGTMSPTGGSDPTWVEHGDSLLGGAVGTEIANKVEKFIEDEFLEEHIDAGTHSVTLYDHRIEWGYYSGDGNDDRVISLSITDLDLKYIFIKRYQATDAAALKTEDLAGDNTKNNDAAAFAADMIQDITTNGQFTIGTNALVNDAADVYYYYAIGV